MFSFCFQDLYLYYFLCRYPGRTLVFSNTVDCVRRLGSLFRLLNFDPWVLHASMQQRQRLKNLDRSVRHRFFLVQKCFEKPLKPVLFEISSIFFSMFRFKSNTRGLLLATDVAARGLDIPSVEHVIHYQVPKDPDVSSFILTTVGWTQPRCHGVPSSRPLESKGREKERP